MYNNILVPVSFDDDRNAAGALEIAQALQAEGGKITLLHVMEQVPNFAISYLPADYRDKAREAISGTFADMANGLPNVSGKVIEGHSGRSILDYAEETGADCIVIASHQPGVQDIVLGSTAAWVVRHAHCAVHVIR